MSYEWGDSEMIFTSDESHNQWQKSLFTETNKLFYFWRAILCPEQLSIADFAIAAKDGLFWPGIVTSYSSIVLARANWCEDLH